jgi:hypothetical protein
MPEANQLPVIRDLPDALEGVMGFADWAKRRSDAGIGKGSSKGVGAIRH